MMENDRMKGAADNLFEVAKEENGFVLAICGESGGGKMTRMMNGMSHDIIAALVKVMLEDAVWRRVVENACVVMTKIEMDKKLKKREI